jgi:hypothetical protein
MFEEFRELGQEKARQFRMGFGRRDAFAKASAAAKRAQESQRVNAITQSA